MSSNFTPTTNPYHVEKYHQIIQIQNLRWKYTNEIEDISTNIFYEVDEEEYASASKKINIMVYQYQNPFAT